MTNLLIYFKNVVDLLLSFEYIKWIIPFFIITSVFCWIYKK